MKRGLAALLCSFLFLSLFPYKSLAKSVRTVVADEGQVIGVNTALGYSTILEFASKPISAVLGDQDAFKLEYVGNSITLKPLVSHARSNLFIFTEYDRFNCQIATVSAPQVDYIVRIRLKQRAYSVEGADQVSGVPRSVDSQQTLLVAPIRKSSSYDGFTLTVRAVSRTRDFENPRAVTLVDFELSSKKKTYSFQPGSVGARQSGKYLNIESIYLDRLELTPGASSIRGKLALLAQDFKASSPFTVVFAVPGKTKKQSVHRIEVSTAKISGAGKPNDKRN